MPDLRFSSIEQGDVDSLSRATTLLIGAAATVLLAVGTAYAVRAFKTRSPAFRQSRLELSKTVEIYAPVEEVYAYWQNLENLSEVMRHVKEVRKLGEDRYYWRVEGAGGHDAQWESNVTARVQDELLAWRSAPGSQVRSSGVVQFEPTEFGGTRLHVRLSYSAPAGPAGHVLVKLLGKDPKRQMNEDLARFKSFIEIGKPIPGEGPATRH